MTPPIPLSTLLPASEDPVRHAEVGLCVLLAAADGDISEGEIGALSSRLGKLLGDDFSAIALAAIVEAEIETMSKIGPDWYVKSLVERLPADRRHRALRGALVIACADGLAPEEESMFRDVATELGFPETQAETMLDEVKRGLPSTDPGAVPAPNTP